MIDIFSLHDYDYFTVGIMEVNTMVQRRVERPKKVKISPKQEELYHTGWGSGFKER